MKYDVKVSLKDYGSELYQVDAINKDDAVSQALQMVVDTLNNVPCGTITWEVETREWMTHAEGLNKTKPGEDVWAFRNGKVEKWHKTIMQKTPDLFVFDRTEDVPDMFEDSINQPSHVMLRIEGEEPPALPMIEPTIYEQVKEICEGNGLLVYGDKWQRRQHQIWEEHHSLWDEALTMTKKHPFYKGCTEKKFDAKLLCSYALQIAREIE